MAERRIRSFKGQGPVDAFVQRNECFGTLNARHFLNFVVQHFAQVLRVAADDFGKNAVVAGGIVNVYDLGNLRSSLATWL
jgi:hypothetical protein